MKSKKSASLQSKWKNPVKQKLQQGESVFGAVISVNNVEIAAQGVTGLRDRHGSWNLFASVIHDIESQLARSDLSIAAHYVELVSPGLRRYADVLRAEFDRCRDAVLAIREEAELLDGDRTQQRAIQLRNPYVDPMHFMQVDLLRRWRATAREDDDLLQALLASVSGIAQGLQTTG